MVCQGNNAKVVSRGAEEKELGICLSSAPTSEPAPLPTSTQQFWVGELLGG
ncbi:hypothetical protein [Nostoc sp.]